MREKINLSGVPETMLQTIYARAKESSGRGAIHDTKAEEIIEKLDYDFSLADKDGRDFPAPCGTRAAAVRRKYRCQRKRPNFRKEK